MPLQLRSTIADPREELQADLERPPLPICPLPDHCSTTYTNMLNLFSSLKKKTADLIAKDKAKKGNKGKGKEKEKERKVRWPRKPKRQGSPVVAVPVYEPMRR